MVTAVVYREPGLLAKAMTTLDVLSGGRAILASAPPGTPTSPPDSPVLPAGLRAVRALEEPSHLQADVERRSGPFEGKHYQLPARSTPRSR